MGDPADVRVMELYFGDDVALTEALAPLEKAAAKGSSSYRQLIVLCSDCIWREFLHRPMLATIASALASANSRRCPGSDPADEAAALVCFQTRSPQNEAIFLRILK